MVFSINAPTSGAETFAAFQASAKEGAAPSAGSPSGASASAPAPSASTSGTPDEEGAAVSLVARTGVVAAVAAAVAFAL
jgi:hypothetical protein